LRPALDYNTANVDRVQLFGGRRTDAAGPV